MKGSKNRKRPPSAGLSIPGVDKSQLEQLLAFMAAHGLEEFEYEHAGLRIRLKKAPASGYAAAGHSVAHAAPAAAPAPAATGAVVAADPAAAAPAAANQPAEDLHIVKSPIVGTFYSAPSPEATPFVKVGDTVQSGQVICIVEAMKLMNEIEADASGEIVRALAENGQPVEYGQGLFAIRATKKK